MSELLAPKALAKTLALASEALLLSTPLREPGLVSTEEYFRQLKVRRDAFNRLAKTLKALEADGY
jgi:hypothetical protein